MGLGIGLALWIFYPPTSDGSTNNNLQGKNSNKNNTSSSGDEDHNDGGYYESYSEAGVTNNRFQNIRRRPLQALLGMFVVMFLCLLLRIRRPNRMYEHAYLTGCDMVHTTHAALRLY